MTVTKPSGEVRHFYARFHVTLRRDGGQWKIAQDWDTDEINGVDVTAEDYERTPGPEI